MQTWNDPSNKKRRGFAYPEVPTIAESLKDTKIEEKEEKVKR